MVQDGSYRTELLLGKGHEVHGLIRRAATFNTDRIEEYYHYPLYTSHAADLHYLLVEQAPYPE